MDGDSSGRGDQTNQGATNTAQPPDRLTVREAAERLGTTEDGVRGRIKRGTLQSERAGGRVFVILGGDQSDQRADRPTGQRTDQSPPPEYRDELVETLRDQVRYLREQLHAESEARTEERRRHDTIVAQLTQRIPAIEPPEASGATESPGAPTEATEQPGRVVEPQEAVEGAQGGAERVSWWRRVFGG